MRIPAGFRTGYPGGEQHVWCVRRIGRMSTLCGKKLSGPWAAGFWPVTVLQPTDPATGHVVCLERLAVLMVEDER